MTFTVTITGASGPVEVYGGTVACDDYLLAMVGDGATAYRALTAGGDDRKRLLRSATLFLDRQSWQGTSTTPAVGGTVLQWPRTGVVNPDGSAVDPNTVPALIVQACFELVALGAADPGVFGAADAGSNVKKLDADGTSIEFFRPTSAADGTAPVLPTVIGQLIGRYLAAATAVVGYLGSSNPGGCSQFDDCDEYKRSGPF